MFAASVPYGTGYYLPTVYTTVFAFSVLSARIMYSSSEIAERRPALIPTEWIS
jgi:hypothetical protein